MSATVKVLTQVNINDQSGDTITKSDTITYTLSEFLNDVITIPEDGDASDEISIYLNTASPLSAFDFLFLKASVSCDVEFTVDQADTAYIFAVTLFPGQPFILGDDSSWDVVGVNAFTGTAADIDKIRIHNNTAGAGTIEIMIGQI